MSRNALIGICMAAVSLGAIAQDDAQDHTAHHPADAPVASATEAPPAPQMGQGQMAGMDRHMKAMQAMHEKMMAAKTPAERQALMGEHMKLMQDGMAMMKSMGGMSGMGAMQGGKGMEADMGARQQMMEKRMDMMESMMQMMMMDRMPSGAPN